MTKSSPSEQERRLAAKLVRLAPKLPRAVVKVLTGPAHRVGLVGPQQMPVGDGKLSAGELRDLGKEVSTMFSLPMPKAGKLSWAKIEERLNYAATKQEDAQR